MKKIFTLIIFVILGASSTHSMAQGLRTKHFGDKKTEETTPTEEETKRVWEKYKALAAGTPVKEGQEPISQNNDISDKNQNPPKASSDAPSNVSGNGLNSLLQQYDQNKKTQRRMRTLIVNRPDPEEDENEANEKKEAEASPQDDSQTDQ